MTTIRQLTNRPTMGQAAILRSLSEDHGHTGGNAFAACQANRWLDRLAPDGLSARGRAALAARGYPLSSKEVAALTLLLGGPLRVWSGHWYPVRDEIPVLDEWVATVTVYRLHNRGLVRQARGPGYEIGWRGLDALGVVPVQPLPEGVGHYTEGSGPRLYAWPSSASTGWPPGGGPAPGWRPGMAAPDASGGAS